MTRTPIAEQAPPHAAVLTSAGTIGSTVAGTLPTRPPRPTSMLGSVAPVATFLLANAAWGLVPGMLASTAVAILAIWARRRRGQGSAGSAWRCSATSCCAMPRARSPAPTRCSSGSALPRA